MTVKHRLMNRLHGMIKMAHLLLSHLKSPAKTKRNKKLYKINYNLSVNNLNL